MQVLPDPGPLSPQELLALTPKEAALLEAMRGLLGAVRYMSDPAPTNNHFHILGPYQGHVLTEEGSKHYLTAKELYLRLRHDLQPKEPPPVTPDARERIKEVALAFFKTYGWFIRGDDAGRTAMGYRLADAILAAIPAPSDATVEGMRKALEPFMAALKIAEHFGPNPRDDDNAISGLAWAKDGVTHSLTWGDFRELRSALQAAGGGEGGAR